MTKNSEDLENKRFSSELSISEQEVHISFMRDEDFATIYVSDSTWITKLDKLCKNNPDMYSVIAETKYGKTYKIKDKSLISLRTRKREISEEQRIAAGERMRKYQKYKKE